MREPAAARVEQDLEGPFGGARLDAALLGLIAKYDRPGPRYTSYPTAPHFRDDFGASDFAGLLARTAAAGRPLSLYVHLPFCAHRCLFCCCNVQIAHDRSRAGRYLDIVEREVERAAELLGDGAGPVVQVHWGGGTPTYLSAAELTRLMTLLRRRFRFAAEAEIGVEVDPRECSPAQLDALAAGRAAAPSAVRAHVGSQFTRGHFARAV